jgi:N-methylhydantoinase A
LDPREFVLLATGGAGPLHVGAYGLDAGVKAVIVPHHASEFSALGIATADPLVVKRASAHMVGPFSSKAVNEVLRRLDELAAGELRAAGAHGDLRLSHSVDMRYKGQVHEVSVPILGAGRDVDAADIMRDFHLQYERRYGKGTTNPAAPIEALSWEVRAAALAATPPPAEVPMSGDASAERKTQRQVYFEGGWRQTPIYERDALHAGSQVLGPAVIEAPDTTILIHPRDTAHMDRSGNIVIDIL